MTRHLQSVLRRFFASRAFLLTLLAVALLIIIGYGRAFYQDYKIKQEIARLQGEVKQLEKKKLESIEILEYVLSKNYVEDKARTELNMKKPGENVVFVTNLEQQKKNEANQVASQESLKNPIKWWYYFTHTPLPASPGGGPTPTL